jgi:hypothetical protein
VESAVFLRVRTDDKAATQRVRYKDKGSTEQDKTRPDQRQQYWYERLGLAPEIDQHVVTQTSKTALGRELSPRERVKTEP